MTERANELKEMHELVDVLVEPTLRSRVLGDANRLIHGKRQEQYGPPEVNFKRIAAGWSVILSADVDAEQVALCMAWLKIARLCEGPHLDSYVDGAAYLALAGELGLNKKVPTTEEST